MDEEKQKERLANYKRLKQQETITARELLTTELPEPVWLIEGLLSDEGMDILAGDPKVGKSWIGLYIAFCCATGRLFLGRHTTKGKVLFVDEENNLLRTKKRLQQLAFGLQLSAEEFEDLYNNLVFSEMKRIVINRQSGNEQLHHLVTVHQPKLIIMDSMVRVMHGDENKAEDARTVFHNLKEFFENEPMKFLFLHHMVKRKKNPDVNDVRGSGDFMAMVDNLLILSRTGNQPQNRFEPATFNLEIALERDAPSSDSILQFTITDREFEGQIGTVIDYAGIAPKVSVSNYSKLDKCKEAILQLLNEKGVVKTRTIQEQIKRLLFSTSTIEKAKRELRAGGKIEKEPVTGNWKAI